MVKHNSYDNPCRIRIYRTKNEKQYMLIYEDECFEFFCTKEELLEELGEHLELMKKGE